MKIADEISIRDGEKDLMGAIVKNIDWRSVEEIIREKHGIGVTEDLRFRQGDLVSHNGQVAYRIHFDVTVPFSMLFDRTGDHVSIHSAQDAGTDRHPAANAENTPSQTENEILEELSREMGALDEESPIELTQVVGTMLEEPPDAAHLEGHFLDSAVNG